MFENQLQELDAALDAGDASVPTFRRAIKSGAQRLAEQFHAGYDVVELVHARARLVDEILTRAWRLHLSPGAAAALIAVGGYGRGELHPASDVDVLILTAEDPQQLAAALEPLVMFLWDIGLEIGHSVRSLAQCVEEAATDLTVVTNLLESRFLSGDRSLFEAMQVETSADRIWPSDIFFSAKLKEQQARHTKVNESSHDLEPNIKTNPGGLRDIQMIGWVAKRHFGASRLSGLKDHGFLSEREYRQLKQGERFLWQVRFALHLLTGRHEDRLLFEHQRALAKEFDYTDENTNLAVEQFMQHYYRTVVQLERLNEMLMQLFKELILLDDELGSPRPINRRFQARGDYIEAINPAIFARYPLAMLEIFLLLQQNPYLKGVRASTIRSIRAHRHLIDGRLRSSIQARSLFMEMLRQPVGITHQLRRMHRYGVLARYIPAFHNITGLMQFDLFHVYTVDEHILMVVRNLRRFAIDKHKDDHPLCNKRFKALPKPELLYLAGLFHDIAKGRGGDHSILGAEDAYQFCREHSLSEYDSRLVAWLVRQHLVMSSTAQRKDIDDPETIQAFAAIVGTRERLDYLYLLTVADMRGTNPGRWNSWKGALIDRLHQRTRAALHRGLDRPQDEDSLIQAAQQNARRLLAPAKLGDQQINRQWMHLSTDYFLQTPPEAIAWHTPLLIGDGDKPDKMQVFIRDDEQRGCNEIFTFGPNRDGLFAQTTACLDQLGINILGARVDVSDDEVSVNSYFVLEDDGDPLCRERQHEAVSVLQITLNNPHDSGCEVARRMPRALKSFLRDTGIEFVQDETRNVTQIHVVTHDRPGLLSLISRVFVGKGVRLHRAQVVTEGAIARDIFTLTDSANRAITDPEWLESIRTDLLTALDN